ncbi:DUF1120 domain-containing protein [Enterobacter hormaechei]|uniref:DUF1120 domain-containing protein n=1 Tax=Enterobacter hormaechei TaxID=158836 RepID=UPI002A759E8A|nr:DUF1120 domain-containing protein [Enterobacter hormaechei]MDY3572547.1 DUF1120 domain-containing protein [Enterobacter hormaechei]
MYMKKELTLILAVVICPFITGSAMAAGTADMSVGGTVITGSCTPTLSASTVDYGTIDVSRLTSTNEKEGNRLGFRDITLNVTCDSPMKVAWGATDNRAETAAWLNSDIEISNGYGLGYFFGLGDTPEGKHIGSYSITLTEPGSTVDGEPAYLAQRHGASGTWVHLANGNRAAVYEREQSLLVYCGLSRHPRAHGCNHSFVRSEHQSSGGPDVKS